MYITVRGMPSACSLSTAIRTDAFSNRNGRSASRDADLPLRLENASVRMAVDRLHALGIPLTVMYTEIEA